MLDMLGAYFLMFFLPGKLFTTISNSGKKMVLGKGMYPLLLIWFDSGYRGQQELIKLAHKPVASSCSG